MLDVVTWLQTLQSDAARNGLSARFRSRSVAFWFTVYLDGVQPQIRPVIAWALEDPERFQDLRETEQSSVWMQRAA